jgi:hypothetical protein
MKIKFLTFFLIIICQLTFSQDITFKSQNTNEPLSNIIVFDASGKIIATSDINGKIDEKDLLPWQEKYTLVYDDYQIAELKESDFSKGTVLLNDKITNIAPVILQDNSKAKYVFIKGYFNQYNLTDKVLNQYLDGEITFVFDNQNMKLKKIILNQYRLFEKPNSDNQKLKVIDIGELRQLSDEKYRNRNKILQTETAGKIYLQEYFAMFTKKPFKLFGAEMKNLVVSGTYVYRKGNLDLNHFSEFNQKLHLEGKSKSMVDFLQYTSYSNFYVTEKSYGDEINLESVDLEDFASHYKTEFWKEEGFPNILPTLNKILNDNLKAVENKN